MEGVPSKYDSSSLIIDLTRPPEHYGIEAHTIRELLQKEKRLEEEIYKFLK